MSSQAGTAKPTERFAGAENLRRSDSSCGGLRAIGLEGRASTGAYLWE